MENVVIVGSGPAGLTAGLYAARAGVKPLVLEGLEPGGQLMQTQHVANYPGIPGTVAGADIIAVLRRQAEEAGARFALDAVESVDFTAPVKKLTTLMGETLEARAVIVASGAGARKTNLPGEAAYWGRGISACLTCDGAFYAGRKVAVVGEGPAVRGAERYLARCGAEVVATCPPAEVASFDGDGKHLTGISRRGGKPPIPCDGLFLVTARVPRRRACAGCGGLHRRLGRADLRAGRLRGRRLRAAPLQAGGHRRRRRGARGPGGVGLPRLTPSEKPMEKMCKFLVVHTLPKW